MWPFRNKDKLKKRKLLINISIGSACALVVAGLGLVIGYVLAPKKVSASDTKSPYFTAELKEDTLQSVGYGEDTVTNGDAIIHIDLYNDAVFSELSCDLNVPNKDEYEFTVVKDDSAQTFTITLKAPEGTYPVKINSDTYGSQEINITVDGDGLDKPYFTTTVTDDSIDSNGDGDAVVQIGLFNDAVGYFDNLEFDDNGTGFSATTDETNQTFTITATGTQTAGDKHVIIKSFHNWYGSHDVVIHVAKVPDPVKPYIIDGPSRWDIETGKNDSIFYKVVDTANGNAVANVTYNIALLPAGFTSYTTDDSQLVIQGSTIDASTNNIMITATSTNFTGTLDKTFTLQVHKYVSAPIIDEIYQRSGDVIEGFSANFLLAADTFPNAKNYLAEKCGNVDPNSEFCMDLHNQKITGEQYAFSPVKVGNEHINNILPLFVKLDFSYAQWQWNSNGNSGDFTFGGTNSTTSCEFSSVKILNLEGSNFAPSNAPANVDIKTANSTFANTNFSSIETLNLSGAMFARSGITVSNNVSTANKTFDSTFLSFETLNLTGAVFSTMNMVTTGAGNVNTADLTFNNATFSSLQTLDLSGLIFASTSMTAGGNVKTASGTFETTTFQKLENLNLYGTVFAMNDMTTTGEVYTASKTFSSTTFTFLENINISGAGFCMGSSTATTGGINTAYCTFQKAIFSKLENLSLAGVVFAINGMTTGGSVSTANHFFEEAKLSKLTTLNFGDCQIGDDNDGVNTINVSCFDSITGNTAWSSNKLKITSMNNDYWDGTDGPDGINALNAWFNSNYELVV